MGKRLVAPALAAGLLLGALHGVRAGAPQAAARAARTHAQGVVFHDRNGDGKRGAGEEGLGGVRVSNGREIVKTDRSGRWRLPTGDDTTFFVIKPRGWMTPVDDQMLPRFYYTHKPQGSPALRFAGVAPTGPLPDSIDFALHPRREPQRFRAIFFGDPQPRNQQEIDYIARDVVEELIGTDASFGVTLGDILFDDLSLFGSLNGTVALIGVPWYNVIGNHDINTDAADDRHSDETFERVYGPPYYSFDHGPVHFIVLDNIEWSGRTPQDRGRFTPGLGRDQIEFLRADLETVPRNQLVVLMMHVPLNQVTNREEVYRLIEQRPYTMSISGHTHYQEHRFITREDGWRGPEPHHHVVNVTVSGSWWSGAPDERGIPHTLMRDGAPNGYSILTFDGSRYSIEFRAAGRPRDYQMNIYAPDAVDAREAGATEVLVNVFAGSSRSRVEMRFGEGGAWHPLEKVAVEDPAYLRLKALEAGEPAPPGRKLPAVMKSPHIWRGILPKYPRPGVHRIDVRTTDMFGQAYSAARSITVRGGRESAERGR